MFANGHTDAGAPVGDGKGRGRRTSVVALVPAPGAEASPGGGGAGAGRGRRTDVVAPAPPYHGEFRARMRLGSASNVVGGWVRALVPVDRLSPTRPAKPWRRQAPAWPRPSWCGPGPSGRRAPRRPGVERDEHGRGHDRRERDRGWRGGGAVVVAQPPPASPRRSAGRRSGASPPRKRTPRTAAALSAMQMRAGGRPDSAPAAASQAVGTEPVPAARGAQRRREASRRSPRVAAGPGRPRPPLPPGPCRAPLSLLRATGSIHGRGPEQKRQGGRRHASLEALVGAGRCRPGQYRTAADATTEDRRRITGMLAKLLVHGRPRMVAPTVG